MADFFLSSILQQVFDSSESYSVRQFVRHQNVLLRVIYIDTRIDCLIILGFHLESQMFVII